MASRPKTPKHGFPASEFEDRHSRARKAMDAGGLDALVVTTPANIRYFTGFETQFWESPTRPWYLIVPRKGEIIAVFPSIGEPAILATTAVRDIRTWSAPNLEDDGVSLMARTLLDLPRKHGAVGWEFGREMLVRAPRIDVDRMAKKARGVQFADGAPIIWGLRHIKSPAEIDRIRVACRIASDAYDEVPRMTSAGDTTRQAELRLRRMLMEKGADHVPFIATAAGQGGYGQIIAGPGEQKLRKGDVLFHDVGCTYDGYFCDFDRNFAVGKIADATQRIHEVLWQATEAGMKAARPGKTMQDVFHVMAKFLEDAGSIGNNVGRIGHGLGLHLTEPPSFMPGDLTVIQPGMVLTIEPGMEYAPGKMLVHEENIAIGVAGNELLTRRAPREMPVLQT
ncbi:MAG: Xaa-Pro peptidase family protein [Hyphomicrobiaceae bacterium]